MATKRKLGAMAQEEEPIDPSDHVVFTCLGGGNEVGRSCHIIQYKGKTVMLDAGMHAGFEGFAALPFYDEFDLSTVDILLISHFHIDHTASLPYVLAKTNFKGRVFMTHSTKAIYKWLIQDSVRVGNTSSSSAESRPQLYDESDHLSTFPRIEAIDYYTTHTASSVRFTPYPAGHVLGAAMFHIEIAGVSVLFTGDYSRENDRHLIPATFPKNIKVDILITESTYGVASHVPRVEREAALMKSVTNILDRGGRVLLPVFALGRAQELLLIFDEYWTKHPEYQKVPIYYASNLARKCMVVYQTYIGSMNDNIKRLFRERMAEVEAAKNKGKHNAAESAGPWDFKFIRSLKSLERFDDVGGCVMLASPGMLQNGVSRELLERWAPDPKNGVIITGYSVEGTMAKLIMNEPDEIQAVMTKGPAASKRGLLSKGGEDEKITVPRRCSIQEYSFAAHVDGPENQDFIKEVDAPTVILVHGEMHNMRRLKSKLLSLNTSKPADRKTRVFSPANAEVVRIPVRTEKIARVVGRLAERVGRSRSTSPRATSPASPSQSTSPSPRPSPDLLPTGPGEAPTDLINNAVLVQHDLKLSLMDAADLREYAGLTTTTITCKQRLKLPSASPELIKWSLDGNFGSAVDVTPEHLKKQAKTNGFSDDGDTSMLEAFDEEIDRVEMHLLVMDTIMVRYSGKGFIEVSWEGNGANDSFADSVIAYLGGLESSPAAIRNSSKKHDHGHGEEDDDGVPKTNGVQAQSNAASIMGKLANEEPFPPVDPRLDRFLMALESSVDGPHVEPVLETAVVPADAEAAKLLTNGDNTTKSENKSTALTIPVPALRISNPTGNATVFLEDMRVETKNAMLRSRIDAILGRSC